MAFGARRSFIGQILVALIISHTLLSMNSDIQMSQVAQATYQQGMNPGMQFRVREAQLNQFKEAMQKFLPYYLNVDINLPTHYQYHVNMFLDFLSWDIRWTNIEYTKADLDITDIKLKFSNTHDRSMISCDFPAFKHWEIKGMQETNFLFAPGKSPVHLTFEDFDFDFQADLVLDENGYLDPIVKDCDIKFGDSYFYHDNEFVAFFMHQFVFFGMVIIENSVYFVGQYIFTNMMGPIMDTFLDHYKQTLYIPSPFWGQDTWDEFRFDYRNLFNPNIQSGYIDLFIVGEILDANDGGCENMMPMPMEFSNNDYSQMVISDAAATCAMATFAKSNIGTVFLNQKALEALFFVEDLTFTTSSIAANLPIFEQKIGYDKPMLLELGFKDPSVMFGQFDTDLIFEYTLKMKYKLDIPDEMSYGQNTELLYDEVRMISTMNIEADDDILYVDLLSHKLDMNSQYGFSSQPVRNSMSLTENEYREFLSTFGFSMNYLKKYLNDVVFREGVLFPYNMEELYTAVDFNEGQMHILFDVYADAYEFFEDEYW